MNNTKQSNRKRCHRRVRSIIKGTAKRPRLNVFKSNTGIFLQLIDDNKGKTLVSAHSREVKTKGSKTEIAMELGKILAKKAIDKRIKNIVFDRGGYKYHGRVKAIADGAREKGLKF